MNEFWNAAVQSTGGPLTDESVRGMLEAMRRQLDEPPRLCLHLHPYSYVKRLRDEGVTETRCRWCGDLCRV
jgi:hypothetical protein